MTLKLADELCAAVDQAGGTVEIDGSQSRYVLMRADLYRDMLGIGTDAEFQASIDALNRGMADVAAGRTRPMKEVVESLGRAATP